MSAMLKQKRLTTGDKRLGNRPDSGADDFRLDIVVIFTSVEATISALKTAGTMAQDLNARITLIAPIVVPYPLPLSRPPIPIDFQERRFRNIASESPIDIRVRLYLCRDGLQTLSRVLKPHSLVIVGGPKHWWQVRERSLTRRLQDSGHEVIFTKTE
jgi:hypothetical protein